MGRHSGPLRFVVARSGVAVVALLALPGRARASEPVEVEVRGDALAGPSREPSVAGGVIREERLRAPGLTASDVLRTQPGITIADTGGYGAQSTASLRGATAAQTPVYLAGVRINDDVGGSADLSRVPLWFVRRIEVYRSNAPLAGDRLGIGGAIFFEPRLPRTTQVGGGAMAGSFGARALWAHGGVGGPNASVLVGVRSEGARNDYPYLNDNGTRFDASQERTERLSNADAQSFDVWALASARLAPGARTNLVVNSMQREQGLPGFALFPSTRARARFERTLGALASTLACGTSCDLTTSTSLTATHTRFEDPLHEANFSAAALDIYGSRVDSAASVTVGLGRYVTVSPSVRVSIERLRLTADDAAAAHGQRHASRAALQAAWAISDAVTVRALGSAECDGTDWYGRSPTATYGDPPGIAGGSRTCHQFEPSTRIGIESKHGALSLLANLGRYARVPTLSELYGLSFGVRGNTALVPETGVSGELGARVAASSAGPLRGAALDVFAFARDAQNLIAFERVTSAGAVRPHNVGSARVLGLELLASYAPVPVVLFELAATFLDPRSTVSGGPTNHVLPYQQRMSLTPRVEWRSRYRGLVSSSRLASALQLTSSRYADSAGLVVIPAQAAWEADAQLGLSDDRLVVRGRLSNLLDQAHFDLIGFPLPGRAAYIALEAQW